jgi:methylmalonyl-CoA mutase C-terminal domain/subunit
MIRVVVADGAADDDDWSARTVALALRDAGMEVIYAGVRQTAEQIAEAVLQEDADVVVLVEQMPRVAELLRDQEARDVIVMDLEGGDIVESIRRVIGVR